MGNITTTSKIMPLDKQSLKHKIKFLNSLNEPYQLKVGSSSLTLKSKIYNQTYYNKSLLDLFELNFINRVKKSIVKSNIALAFEDDYFPEDINYVNVNKKCIGHTFDNSVEVDANQAYWETARMWGVIDEDIYQEGMTHRKIVRLVALGSLAKKTDIYEFDGRTLRKVETKRSMKTENIWYSICKRLSDVMGDIKESLGDDYLFYWVDGIYMENSKVNIKKAQKLFKKHGYESKIEPINSIVFKEEQFFVYDPDTDKPRPFNYPRSDWRISDIINIHRLKKVAADILSGKDEQEWAKKDKKQAT